MPTDTTLTTEQLAARLVVTSSRFARAAARRAAGEHSVGALRVLGVLSRQGGTRVGALAARELATQPGMTATVNRLEAAGLVVKRPDEADKRAAVVEITAAGEAELARFRARTGRAAGPVLDALTDEDRETLRRAADLVDRLTDHLDAV